MIDRYSLPQMKKVFSLENKFSNYLKVEIEVCRYLYSTGKISAEEFNKIEKNANFDLAGILELEKETKHDVIAFTRNVSSYLGEEKKWIHYGLTSSDVIDTGWALMFKEANALLKEKMEAFKEAIKKKALDYKYTPCIGRTHGIHADITSFGLKWALYFDEFNRDFERFCLAAKQIEAGMISGAVGTYPILPLECQNFVCEHLGLNSSKVSNQIIQRDNHAFYSSCITIFGTLIEKIALEIRNLQRTEINEVAEYFAKGQKGSSAMPHKHNPIGSENLTGCARLLRGYNMSILEDNALYHERDISHSSVERVALVDSVTLLDYMLDRMTKIIDGLLVYPERMKENISLTHNVIYSQYVMTALIEKGLSREAAYDLIQSLSYEAYEQRTDFFELLESNHEVLKHLSKEEIQEFQTLTFNKIDIDAIYKRVGL